MGGGGWGKEGEGMRKVRDEKSEEKIGTGGGRRGESEE